MSTVLFDLDGVLTRGDTMAALVLGQLVRRPWRLPAAVQLLLGQGRRGGDDPRRQDANRALVALALRGETLLSYRGIAMSTASRLADRRSFVRSAAVAEVRHRATQSRVLVVTASEEILVRAFLRRLGLEGVEVLASAVSFTEDGGFLQPHNIGAAKLLALQQAGVDVRESTFFTDSAADLPMAEAAAAVVVVGPLSESGRELLRRLPTATVVIW